MKKEVEEMVQHCDICQKNKSEHVPYPGLLQPLPIPDKFWTHITMDFIEGLPKSFGKDVILVVVDRLSKYAHFVALSHPYTAQTVAKLFIDNVYKLHGPPVSIVSDRDKVFTSQFWRELFKAMGTSLDMTTAYHPQSDGQSERVNQCLEGYLRCMAGTSPKQWAKWLSLAEYWYNTSYHSGLKCSPYQALYGMTPPHTGLGAYVSSPNQEVKEWLSHRQEMVSSLKKNLILAQERMSWYANKQRSERSFEVGDFVYLKLQPYRQNSVMLRRNLKLAAKYYGPYKIEAKIGSVAYKLQLPESSKIHPVFHVSLLKKCLGKQIVPSQELPEIDVEGHFKVMPFSVLEYRTITRNGKDVPQGLVQWTRDGAEAAEWMDLKTLRRKFDILDPCGQGSEKQGGIVMNLDLVKRGESGTEAGLKSEDGMDSAEASTGKGKRKERKTCLTKQGKNGIGGKMESRKGLITTRG